MWQHGFRTLPWKNSPLCQRHKNLMCVCVCVYTYIQVKHLNHQNSQTDATSKSKRWSSSRRSFFALGSVFFFFFILTLQMFSTHFKFCTSKRQRFVIPMSSIRETQWDFPGFVNPCLFSFSSLAQKHSFFFNVYSNITLWSLWILQLIRKSLLWFCYCSTCILFVFSTNKNTCQKQQRHGLPWLSCFPLHRAGIIRTALADMDREAREHYTVVIQAKDMAGQVGGLSGSTTINITLTDINDNPPKFPQSTYTARAADPKTFRLCNAKAKMTRDKLWHYHKNGNGGKY